MKHFLVRYYNSAIITEKVFQMHNAARNKLYGLDIKTAGIAVMAVFVLKYCGSQQST